MRRIRTVGDQKGDHSPRGEESIISWSPPHHLSFLAISTALFSMGDTTKIEEKPCKEEINKKIREWDLKLIQGKISEEEYLSRLNKLSLKKD